MNRTEKEQFVSDLRARLEKAQGVFLVHYQGLKVEDLEKLRDHLRESGAEFQVVKNRLLKLACKGTETESLKDQMQGPTAVTLSYDDVVSPAKAIVEFAKDFDKLKIITGQISGKEFSEAGLKKLATLPGRDILLSQVLGGLQAVPAGFVRILAGLISQLLYALKAIEQQKQA